MPSRGVRRIVRPVGYSILFRQFPLDQLDALAPVVAEIYGINDYDARTKIRKGWGFLERDASKEEALRIVEGVGDYAGGVVCIDEHRAPHVWAGTPRDHGCRVRANGLTLRLQSPKNPPVSLNGQRWHGLRGPVFGGDHHTRIGRGRTENAG